MKTTAAVIILGTLLVVGCGDGYSPSSPSSMPMTDSPNGSTPMTPPASSSPLLPQGQGRTGFGFNAAVSGFPTGVVSLTGGGSYTLASHAATAGGGFKCLESVLQGPLGTSINPNDLGACLAGQGIRWDTAALLDSTTFKCTASATGETAVTNGNTVVLQADFYRAGNGNDESFRATMIVSDHDISTAFPGVNVWVQGVGCGTAQAVNFSH